MFVFCWIGCITFNVIVFKYPCIFTQKYPSSEDKFLHLNGNFVPEMFIYPQRQKGCYFWYLYRPCRREIMQLAASGCRIVRPFGCVSCHLPCLQIKDKCQKSRSNVWCIAVKRSIFCREGSVIIGLVEFGLVSHLVV